MQFRACLVEMPSNSAMRAGVRPKTLRSASRLESPRRQLERRYRAALSGAVVAKAYYLAQVGDGFSTPVAVERARREWERIESRRHRLAAQMAAHDGSEPTSMRDLFADDPGPLQMRQGSTGRS